MKLATKLTLSLIILAAVMGGVLVYFISTSSIQLMDQEIRAKLENTAFHISDKIDRMLFERYGDIKLLANDPLLRSKSSTPEQITKKLTGYKNIYQQYASLSFFDLNRKRIADTEGLDIGKQHALSEYWPEIAQGKDFIVNFSRSESLKGVVTHFVHIVRDMNGIPFGVIVSRVPSSVLYEITKKFCHNQNPSR